MKCVVDTNVPLVANKRAAQASSECVSTCAVRLRELTRRGKLVLDDGWRILKEYMANLRSDGQPGPGDAFLKWVHTNYSNPDRCELVRITPSDSSETDFEEFPTDPELRNFDLSDRKFIAVALAHPEKPPILQATDAEWWEMRESFRRAGVTIDFVCQEDIKAISRRRETRQ
jgi:hypothetical protein